MDWKLFFKEFLRNTLTVILLAVIGLGGIGYLVGGKAGLANGASWGLILGLVGIPFTVILILAKYWGDFAGRYGQWWIKKETDGED
jgi:hypothetical protein